MKYATSEGTHLAVSGADCEVVLVDAVNDGAELEPPKGDEVVGRAEAMVWMRVDMAPPRRDDLGLGRGIFNPLAESSFHSILATSTVVLSLEPLFNEVSANVLAASSKSLHVSAISTASWSLTMSQRPSDATMIRLSLGVNL